MKLNKDARTLCRELFQLCLSNGKVQDGRVRMVVDALITKRPRNYFQILRTLARLIRLNLAERQAEVQSALSLSSQEMSLIERDLKSIHGDDLEIHYRVVPSLLGGLRIRIGSEVWDGTIADRLHRILTMESHPTAAPSLRSFPCIKTSSSENFKTGQLAI